MAVKICTQCGTPKTVQPRADNTVSYWTCMRCCQHEIKPKKIMLTLRTGTQSLRAA
jgi:Zn ribbon nucleic-acid-binding protein